MGVQGNIGQTSLRRRQSTCPPMTAYDGLSPELRRWLATAALPWGPQSVRKAYAKALAQTGDPAQALRRLDALQAAALQRDAARVWGPAHPNAG